MQFKVKSKIRRRIISITLIISLVPLLISLFISLYLMRYTILDSELKNYEEYASIILNDINSKILSYNESLTYLSYNSLLLEALAKDYDTNFEMYDLYRNTINPIFNTVLDQHRSIDSITLYTTKPLYNHGNYLIQLDNEAMQKMFTLSNYSRNRMVFDPNKQELYAYSRLVRNDIDTINVVKMSIHYDDFFEVIQSIQNEDFSINIVDEDKQIIFESIAETDYEDSSFFRKWINRLLLIPESIQQTHTLDNNWIINFHVQMDNIYEITNTLIITALLLFSFIMILIFYLLRYLTRTIADPIKDLVHEMNNASENNFTVQNAYVSDDEIGELYDNYTKMLDQIKTLIDEVYNAEIHKQKSELRALQSQINPHFFYNSLSLINNKAIMSGNTEISQMALLLSKFYRLSLNNGNNLITVKQELELTITYAKIQQKMHKDTFDLNIEIDDIVNNKQMIYLLLQPFVENAIFHGIDHKENGHKGNLMISAHLNEDNIIFKIIDNGAGMDEDFVKTILSSQSDRYGIKNVLQRISLYYHKDDAVQIFSEKNIGTEVIIKLPLDIVS